jgi:spore maturation protein A
MAAGIIYAAISGRTEALNTALFASAENTPKLILELCGMICLWTGLMKVAEKSGLVAWVGKLLGPVMRLIFPDVPRDNPAFFAILMNISTNLLGIGNAATPFGLKAMYHLQQLNGNSEVASPAMITFLALNTSGITLMPSLVIGLRVAAGSLDPTSIIGPTIVASCIGTVFALVFDRLMRLACYRR